MPPLRKFQTTWMGIAKVTTAMTKSACLWPIGILLISSYCFLLLIYLAAPIWHQFFFTKFVTKEKWFLCVISYCWFSWQSLHSISITSSRSTVSISLKSRAQLFKRWGLTWPAAAAPAACLLVSVLFASSCSNVGFSCTSAWRGLDAAASAACILILMPLLLQ